MVYNHYHSAAPPRMKLHIGPFRGWDLNTNMQRDVSLLSDADRRCLTLNHLDERNVTLQEGPDFHGEKALFSVGVPLYQSKVATTEEDLIWVCPTIWYPKMHWPIIRCPTP